MLGGDFLYNDIYTMMAMFFLVISGFVIVVNVLNLIANVILFDKIKINKWFGLVPILNDYILFESFWSQQAFITYVVLKVSTFLLSKVDSDILGILYFIITLIVLVMEVSLMSRISRGFDKGFWFTIGLIILQPVFIIILALKYEPVEDVLLKTSKSRFAKKDNSSTSTYAADDNIVDSTARDVEDAEESASKDTSTSTTHHLT